MTKANTVDLAPYRKAAGELESEQDEADQSIELLEALKIETAEDQDFAASILLDVKAKHSELETRRKSVVQPLNGVVREINSWFKPVRDRLERAERLLKTKIAAYIQEQEADRRRALEAAAVAETAAEASTALAASAEPIATAAGTSSRKVWRFRVTDESAVPRQWLTVNVDAIAGYVKATKGKPQPIPGVEFFQETVISASRRG